MLNCEELTCANSEKRLSWEFEFGWRGYLIDNRFAVACDGVF